jgi:hypothetical protein
MSVRIFLSTVSDEFRAYRDALRGDLTRHNVEVKVQEDFKDLGGDTLDQLDVYIAHCDAVVHLVGDMTGSAPPELPLKALRKKYPDLADKLPPLGEALLGGVGLSYTQWEAWLALYHDKRLFIAKAADGAERGPSYAPTELARGASRPPGRPREGRPSSRPYLHQPRRSRLAHRLYRDSRSSRAGVWRGDRARSRRRGGFHP